jgi:hypothetical protein
MYSKLICLTIIFSFTYLPSAFPAGGKVTVHNARFVYSMKYMSNDKIHDITFDPQNEGGQYRLKGKRNFQVLEININENSKEKVCKCNEDALFRWRTRHPVDVRYKSEYEGFDGLTVNITGTLDRKFKEIKCACEQK